MSYDPNLLASIGYDRRDNLAYFTGDIDEVRVWTATLSQADFLTLYNAGAGYGYPWGTCTLATFVWQVGG